MFDINEHTALQAGRNHQQVNQKAAKLAAKAALAVIKLTASILQKLIQGIINRLQGKKDGSIEIKVNNQLVFKGKTGEKPTINKLNLNDLTAILESAIVDSKQKLELLVKADNKMVYASNQGKVKLDQLDAFLQAAKNPESISKAASTAMSINEQGALNYAKQLPDYELESNSLITVLSAKRILDKLQTNQYENNNYSFQREDNNITVSAKDGRGEIAQLEAGRITGKNLSHNDVTSLVRLADELELQPPENSPEQAHNTNSEEEHEK